MPLSPVSIITKDKIRRDVHTALKLWHKDESAESPFASLYLYGATRPKTSTNRQATNQILLNALKSLATRHPDDATVLRGRFLDRQKVYVLANELNVAESTVYKMQRDAIDRLAATLLALEEQALAARQNVLVSRLEPPTYIELVGVADHLDHLIPLLLDPSPPWLLSIEGIGGIGKTSLADALMRRLFRLPGFVDFAWVSARQQVFLGGGIRPVAKPVLTSEVLVETLAAQLIKDLQLSNSLSPEHRLAALQVCLKQSPHLIAIDNLETVLDLESLLPMLHLLAEPSKFVLTSRQSFFFEPGLHHFIVPELSESDALKLLRLEAQLRGFSQIVDAADADLLPIYHRVGGNPLALRLVIGQTYMAALDTVLDDLAAASGTAEEFYTYIFWQAWERLDPPARQVLIAMPLVAGHGGTIDDLAAVIELDKGQVHEALEELVTLNLVDCRGTLNERRYTIHNLTRTFLLEQVVKWQ